MYVTVHYTRFTRNLDSSEETDGARANRNRKLTKKVTDRRPIQTRKYIDPNNGLERTMWSSSRAWRKATGRSETVVARREIMVQQQKYSAHARARTRTHYYETISCTTYFFIYNTVYFMQTLFSYFCVCTFRKTVTCLTSSDREKLFIIFMKTIFHTLMM